MKFKIHFTVERDGAAHEDWVVVEASTVAECTRLAEKAVSVRGARDAWSEEIASGEPSE